jgi:UDP-sugar pyrophosphorylase
LNVQLDPLLRSTEGFSNGDVADPETGSSPFPGNINCLVFAMKRYKETLDATGGGVKEFVNPKYADAAKKVFKSPTRLECMMQDFPLLLPPEANVGFTQMDRWLCFSPVKNNIHDAAAKAAQGLPPECAGTAERDAFDCNCRLLRLAGVEVAPPAEGSGVEFAGIPLTFGPQARA